MSIQFKNFLQFTILASIIILVPIISDKYFQKDLFEYIGFGIVIFLLALWYKIFYQHKKSSVNLETEVVQPANIVFTKKRQLIGSLVLSLTVFMTSVFLYYPLNYFGIMEFFLRIPQFIFTPIRIFLAIMYI